jgi:hypothetical protein
MILVLTISNGVTVIAIKKPAVKALRNYITIPSLNPAFLIIYLASS